MGLADGGVELFCRPRYLIESNDRGRGDEQMIARDSVHAALHGIDEQATTHGGRGYTSGEIHLRWKRLFGGFVGDKLHGPKQTKAANIADDIESAKGFEFALQ